MVATHAVCGALAGWAAAAWETILAPIIAAGPTSITAEREAASSRRRGSEENVGAWARRCDAIITRLPPVNTTSGHKTTEQPNESIPYHRSAVAASAAPGLGKSAVSSRRSSAIHALSQASY